MMVKYSFLGSTDKNLTLYFLICCELHLHLKEENGK